MKQLQKKHQSLGKDFKLPLLFNFFLLRSALLVFLLMNGLFAGAQTNDYPWPNATCNTPNYTYSMYYKNCTDWVAWKLNQNQDGSPKAAPHAFKNDMFGSSGSNSDCSPTSASQKLRNACRWDNVLQNNGYFVTNTPTPGAIAQWNENEIGNPNTSVGHVAYVESVSSADVPVLSHYNYSPLCNYAITNNLKAPRYIRFNRFELINNPTIQPIVQGEAFNMKANIKNNHTTSVVIKIRAALYSSTNQFVGVLQEKTETFNPGQTKLVSFYKSNISSSPGSYKVWIETRVSTSTPFTLVHKYQASSTQNVEITGGVNTDIYMNNYYVNDNTVNVGQSIKAYVRQNMNPSSAPYAKSYLYYYFSTDNSLSSNDTYLGSDWSSIGNNDPYDNENLTFTVPNVPSGTHYVLIRCDATNVVSESNESNNLIAIPVTVSGGGGKPDVFMNNYYVNDNTVNVGQSIKAYVRQNINPSSAPYAKSYLYYYFSTDNSLSSNDTYLGSDWSSIGNNDPYDDENLTFTVPNVPSGTRYVLIRCDATNIVSESNENNNIVAIPVTVSGSSSPDIYMNNYYVNDNTVNVGQSIKAYVRQNMNPSSAPYAKSYLYYYFSTDNSLSSNDTYLGNDWSSIGNNDSYDDENLTFTVPNVPSGTRYVLIRCDATNVVSESNESNNLISIPVTVSGSGSGGNVTYCNSKGSNSSYEWINQVKIYGSPTLNKISGNNNGYANYTSLSTSMNAGSSYSFVGYPGFSSGSYNEYWTVWIDFDQDGNFESNEKVFTKSSTGTVSGSMSIPSNAKNGSTRMRVIMKYSSYANPCGTYNYGETEDYTINISGGSGKTSQELPIASSIDKTNLEVNAYPNPLSLGAVWHLDFVLKEDYHQEVTLTIYDISGKIIDSVSTNAQSIGVHNYAYTTNKLSMGTYYYTLSTGNHLAKGKLVIIE